MRLFEYDESSLLAGVPEMYAFQKVRWLSFQDHSVLFSNVTTLAALGHIYCLATQN